GQIEARCDAAVDGMAGVFAPSRDLDACGLVISVYEELARAARRSGPRRKGLDLRRVAARVRERLEHPTSEASVSAYVLEELHEARGLRRGYAAPDDRRGGCGATADRGLGDAWPGAPQRSQLH